MPITKDKIVSIAYTVTSPEGEVIDSTEQRGPLAYLHGRGNIIPALENALEGHSEGERLSLELPPEQAYGQRDEQLVQDVDRKMFEHVEKLEPGMRFEAQTQGGGRLVKVLDVSEEKVTIDANHPLAGVPLQFQVDVMEVRDATPEEIAHGHAHGASDQPH